MSERLSDIPHSQPDKDSKIKIGSGPDLTGSNDLSSHDLIVNLNRAIHAGRKVRKMARELEQGRYYRLMFEDGVWVTLPNKDGRRIPVLLTRPPDPNSILAIAIDSAHSRYFEFSIISEPPRTNFHECGTILLTEISSTRANHLVISRATENPPTRIIKLQDLPLDDISRKALNPFIEREFNDMMAAKIDRMKVRTAENKWVRRLIKSIKNALLTMLFGPKSST